MPHCSCEDASLYYEAIGEGFPLLLISGLSGGTWSWYGQVPCFQKHFKTIVYDNRGAGRSSLPPGPYHMDQFAADALCLLDSLGVSRAFVLGLSMGGMIAQELAVLAPDRIRALFLGCTHCGGGTKISPSPDVLRLLVANDGLTQRRIIEKNLPLFFSAGFLKTRPEAIEEYIEAQLRAPLQPDHAFAAQLAAIRAFDLCGRLHRVGMPTLIATGTEDILVPAGNARLLAERIPHSSVAELPGAGHAIHVEQRDRLNELALNFFRSHSA